VTASTKLRLAFVCNGTACAWWTFHDRAIGSWTMARWDAACTAAMLLMFAIEWRRPTERLDRRDRFFIGWVVFAATLHVLASERFLSLVGYHP
jgi:hypothetical protein